MTLRLVASPGAVPRAVPFAELFEGPEVGQPECGAAQKAFKSQLTTVNCAQHWRTSWRGDALHQLGLNRIKYGRLRGHVLCTCRRSLEQPEHTCECHGMRTSAGQLSRESSGLGARIQPEAGKVPRSVAHRVTPQWRTNGVLSVHTLASTFPGQEMAGWNQQKRGYRPPH